MPRRKKETLKIRKDGRYRTIYKGIPFYGKTSDEAIMAREVYKEMERQGEINNLIGPTVENYAWKFLKNAKAGDRPQTKREAEIHMKKLIARYGFYRLNDIKPSDIKEIYVEDYADLSDSYIKSACQLYRAFFDAAVEDGYCKYNPARMKSSRPTKGYESNRHPITEQEREWILNLCTDHKLHAAVIAMLYAGIRPPEAKALNIDNAFDNKKMELTISEFAHLKDNNHYEVDKKGKTKKSIRKIPVFPPLYDVLKDKHGLLIPTRDNEICTIQAWKSAWKSYIYCMNTAINGCPKRWYGKTKEHKAILAAGGKLPEWKEFKIVPYQLRHGFCTWGRDNGVELNTMISWMGHKDAKMILKIYDEATDYRQLMEAEKINKNVFKVQYEVQPDGSKIAKQYKINTKN